jgi:hypothetical protein
LRKLVQVTNWNQPTVVSMLDYFVDPLTLATDYGPPASHGFQIYAAQPLISAGQHKDSALTHSCGNFVAASLTEKMDSIGNSQTFRQRHQTLLFASFANDPALKAGMRFFQSRQSAQNQFMTFYRG